MPGDWVPGDWVPGEKEPFFLVGADNVEFEGVRRGAGGDLRGCDRCEPDLAAQGAAQRVPLPEPLPRQDEDERQERLDETFLDGLAGKYVDRNGKQHEAENDRQSYRRFPIIVPVRSDEFDVLVNKGFVNGNDDEFKEYIAYEEVRQNMRQVLRRVKGVEPVDRHVEAHLAIEAKQVTPIKEQYEVVVSSVSTENEDPEALIAEFTDLGEPISAEERAARHEQRMIDALSAKQGFDRPEVIDHFRAAHLAGVDTPDGSDFIHRDSSARYWCTLCSGQGQARFFLPDAISA